MGVHDKNPQLSLVFDISQKIEQKTSGLRFLNAGE